MRAGEQQWAEQPAPRLSRPAHPEIRQLVLEASQALARLDAARLEELALSCLALNRDLASGLTPELPLGLTKGSCQNDAAGPDTPRSRRRGDLARQAREARGDMAIFGRVLDGTRSNLNVLHRLREQRAGRLEYSVPAAASDCAWRPPEPGHGDD